MKSAIDSSIEHLRPWMPWASREPEDLQRKIDLLRHFHGQFDLGVDFVYGIFNQDEDIGDRGDGVAHSRRRGRARNRLLDPGGPNRSGFRDRGLGRADAAWASRSRSCAESRSTATRPTSEVQLSRRKLGYTHEATLRRRIASSDADHDQMVWTMLADESPGSRASHALVAAYDVMGRKIE